MIDDDVPFADEVTTWQVVFYRNNFVATREQLQHSLHTSSDFSSERSARHYARENLDRFNGRLKEEDTKFFARVFKTVCTEEIRET